MHKVYLRADGSAAIGYGHVHRLLSLAQMLQKDFECIFVSHEATEFLLLGLKKLSIPFIKINSIVYKFPDEKKEGEEIVFDMDAILQGNEIVVLDGYWFGKKYQQEIKKKGCTLVYVDDLAEKGAVADCIINHSLGVSCNDYKNISPATCVYLGSPYSLINVPEKFRHQQLNKNIFTQLLIAMGGADPLNFTGNILDEYKSFIQQFEKVVVLVGNGYQCLQQLQAAAISFSGIKIIKNISKEEVFGIMQMSPTAILSASTMAVEYAHIGGALAVIQTAANQHFLYKGLLENNVALSVENMTVAKEEQLEKLQINQRKIFDGQSQQRFVKLFNELKTQVSLTFIDAGKEQVDITYQWASNTTVRAYSFNQQPISFDEHRKWYLDKIEQADCMYLLGLLEKNIVGSIRFDITGTIALISYLVAPQFHGIGLGRILLAKGLEYLAQNNTAVTRADGYVMAENIASVKVFERLGFVAEIQTNRILFTKNIYR